MVFLFPAHRVQNEQSPNCKVSEVKMLKFNIMQTFYNLCSCYLASPPSLFHIVHFHLNCLEICSPATQPPIPISLQIVQVHFHADNFFKFICHPANSPSYLTSHIYFMLFLSLSCVAPPHTTVRESLFPHWFTANSLKFEEEKNCRSINCV